MTKPGRALRSDVSVCAFNRHCHCGMEGTFWGRDSREEAIEAGVGLVYLGDSEDILRVVFVEWN